MKLILLVNYGTVNILTKTLHIVTCCIFCICAYVLCVLCCWFCWGLELLCIRNLFSDLSLLLVLEALSHQFRTGVPGEALYAEDLAVMADSMEECIARVKGMDRGHRTQETESQHEEDDDHGLKTWDIPFSVTPVHSPVSSGVNSTQCSKCRLWVHK